MLLLAPELYFSGMSSKQEDMPLSEAKAQEKKRQNYQIQTAAEVRDRGL